MKKSIRIVLLAILVLAIGLVFCGCTAKNTDESADDNAVDKQEPKVEETQKVDIIDSAEYKFERIDESIKDENGNIGLSWFFDKLVIEGTNPAADIINADMDKKSAEFFSNPDKQEVTDTYNRFYDSDYDYSLNNSAPLFNTAEGAVAYNNAGIISVSYMYNWLMGGVHNLNYDGVTYDLNTGKELHLSDLLSGSDAEILARVQNAYWNAIVEHYKPEELFEGARATLEAKTLDDYKFYVADDGEIYLIADTYEFAPGAAGPYAFASGLFIKK